MFSKKEKVAPRHVRAIKSYTAQHETELSFQEGDLLLQLDESFGWLEGELNGARGWFPHDHVEAVGSPLAQGGGIQPVDETEPGMLQPHSTFSLFIILFIIYYCYCYCYLSSSSPLS